MNRRKAKRRRERVKELISEANPKWVDLQRWMLADEKRNRVQQNSGRGRLTKFKGRTA